MLQSHLYGREKNLSKEIPFSEIASARKVDKRSKSLYKKMI